MRNLVEMRLSNVDKHARESEWAVRLCNYVDVHKHEYIGSEIDFMAATATADEIARFGLATGDVLITKDSEDWTDIGVPAVVEEAAQDVLCGYHLALLRPRAEQIRGPFLFRALQANAVAAQFHVRANGVTRYGLTQEAIKSIWLPVPPLAEQAAIARFLDHATSRISRYIRAKQKLIALLDEYKQVLIHEVVTGQIDVQTGKSYPEYRESGVEWIGNIPTHWKDASLRFAAKSIQIGPFGSQLHASDYVEGGTPVVNPSHLRDCRIEPDQSVTINDQKGAELARHRLEPLDIVMARRGELGRCALVGEREAGWFCGTGSLRVRLDLEVAAPEFLVLVLGSNGTKDSLSLSSVGATMENLNSEIVSRLRVPLPPLREQRDIVNFVDNVNSHLEWSMGHIRGQISLLREYSTRLIADVVTGKIDVRSTTAVRRYESDSAVAEQGEA
ncbi:MAG: restriction endonuclease subunit S [Gammaproteobacteria bacterium]|nr:restriction endonuclease subunit S [Gammaproteobacteria bacterium]